MYTITYYSNQKREPSTPERNLNFRELDLHAITFPWTFFSFAAALKLKFTFLFFYTLREKNNESTSTELSKALSKS